MGSPRRSQDRRGLLLVFLGIRTYIRWFRSIDMR